MTRTKERWEAQRDTVKRRSSSAKREYREGAGPARNAKNPDSQESHGTKLRGKVVK